MLEGSECTIKYIQDGGEKKSEQSHCWNAKGLYNYTPIFFSLQILGHKPTENLCHLPTAAIATNIGEYLKAPEEVKELYVNHVAILVRLGCFNHLSNTYHLCNFYRGSTSDNSPLVSMPKIFMDTSKRGCPLPIPWVCRRMSGNSLLKKTASTHTTAIHWHIHQSNWQRELVVIPKQPLARSTLIRSILRPTNSGLKIK